MPIKVVRRSYRPKNVNVLFVGESAPAAGTFFYIRDSLTKYTKEAFSNVYGVNFNSDKEFLVKFKANKYYLDDLCLVPINNTNQDRRVEARRNSVSNLSNRIKDYSPNAIICIMIAIKPYVLEAMRLAEIRDIPFYSVAFPSHGHQSRYIEELSNSLIELQKAKIIGETLL